MEKIKIIERNQMKEVAEGEGRDNNIVEVDEKNNIG